MSSGISHSVLSKANKKNLVLTGLMGSGKSTIGPLVANNLKREFIDTDEYIDEHFGPTADIFNHSDGDVRFSLIEERVARDLSSRDNLVIASGGRFMINQANIDAMGKNGYILCLIADLDEIVDRLLRSHASTFRPRFAKASNKYALMEELQRQSEPYYSQFFQLQTTRSSPSEVARKVCEWFQSEARK